MLYREIIAVCSEIHIKLINELCGQNAELLNVKPGVTYNDHWAARSQVHGQLRLSVSFVGCRLHSAHIPVRLSVCLSVPRYSAVSQLALITQLFLHLHSSALSLPQP
jgi:hypothetical protein